MKHNDVPNKSLKITPQNYENIFNVYEDEDEGWYYYDLLKKVNFPEDLNPNVYTFYTVNRGDIWPTLAWKFYRNVKLWWIICAANQIQNPTQLPAPGTQLKILNTTTIRNILNQLKDN